MGEPGAQKERRRKTWGGSETARAEDRERRRQKGGERAFIVKYYDKSPRIRASLFCFVVEERRGSIFPLFLSPLCAFSVVGCHCFRNPEITSSLMCHNRQWLAELLKAGGGF